MSKRRRFAGLSTSAYSVALTTGSSSVDNFLQAQNRTKTRQADRGGRATILLDVSDSVTG